MASSKPRLFAFNDHRQDIVEAVTRHVCAHRVEEAGRAPSQQLEYVLNEAAFHEIQRLEKFGADDDIGEVGGLGFWRGVARRVGHASEKEKERLLRKVVASYAGDVAGNFDPRVYAFANKVLPVGLALLFNTQNSQTGVRFRKLRDRIRIEGDLDTLRALSQRGTFVVAPTHVSNLDSIVVGWALAEAGLPPVTYGAGKNLFSNALISYFMHNLGAYKVDRRIRHHIYKECLKAYSEELLTRGFHSLFFPGGTRSRSGEVEDKLKLGLLGTSITAYQRRLKAGNEERIFLVPMTLNFGLVMEAGGLINDHLRAVGREYYLLPDDPFDSPWEVVRFMLKLAEMETSMVIRFGQPMDVLGNRVDAEGNSYDARGHQVDPASYFTSPAGEVEEDAARDREYTRQAGRALSAAFVRETVLMPTQFVSYVLFEAARRRFPGLDLARVLRFGKEVVVPWQEVNAEATQLRDRLLSLQRDGQVRLNERIAEASVPELVEEGLSSLGAYHAQEAAVATGQGVRLQDMNLLCYYSNRLRCLEVG